MGDPSSGSSASFAEPMSSHAGLLDATIFDAKYTFDLDAFLRDVDHALLGGQSDDSSSIHSYSLLARECASRTGIRGEGGHLCLQRTWS